MQQHLGQQSNYYKMLVADQIQALKKRFKAPSAVRLLCHKSPEEDEVAMCCQAAKASIHGAVVASAANEGIIGVIEYFTANFMWGCVQSQHYCECVANKMDLFCIATTCVGLECLGLYKSLSAHKMFDLMIVEFIISDCASVIRTEKQHLAEASRNHSKEALSQGWVLDDTFYHVLVGLVDQQLNLTICDYDALMPFLVAENGSSTKIQSMRVSRWEGDVNPGRSINEVNWNGTKIALNRWVDDTNSNNGDTIVNAVETLGNVYSTGLTHPQTSLHAHVHPSATSLTTASASSNSSSSPNAILPEPSTIVPTVFISGTYMGPNPCPGVGIARALRAALGAKEVRLISVGDSEFSDPVFDAHWPVLELGAAVYLTGPTKAQTQWDLVSELILTQIEASKADGNPVFFIPVSNTQWFGETHPMLQHFVMIAFTAGVRCRH